MTFSPTPEQAAIVEAARSTTDNLLVSALAGAAKTSTLVLIAEALPETGILCLAFNKRIATEMQDRLPSNCVAMTLNSLGHRVWGQTLRKRLIVDTRKTYSILTTLIEPLSRSERMDAFDRLSELIRAVEYGKSAGYIPSNRFPDSRPLMGDDDFFAKLEEEPTALEERLIREATLVGLKQSFDGKIDFSDQILMPTVFPSTFPQYPLVLIDEAQDLSALNHATLRKLARKRLIAVGDECQAIYGFRGAHEESMAALQESFHMRRLTLSISFRCPQAVVEAAQWRAPHMRWPDWAKLGTVERPSEWGVADVPDSAAIVCRNNAPIFTMAIKLLKNGRYPQVIGNDIGKVLVKYMKKFGPMSMPQAEVFAAIETWTEAKLKKVRDPSKAYDQADCMRVFAEQGETLGDAIAYAEHIFAATGPIQMMTVHKAKGLEYENVFILDQHLIRVDGDEAQEKNLLYVAQTRAKERLVYVNSEDFVEEVQ
jgi:DNA helicase-2/ATP-dependent DNA helicase PcrA